MSVAENHPAKDHSANQDPLDSDAAHRFQQLRTFGDFTLAYSCWKQPILQHFDRPEGFISYARKWGYTFVLGNPVADKKDWSSLIDEFLKKFKRVNFVQASDGVAEIITERGFYVNDMGYDTYLNLSNYDFSGKTKEKIRYAFNWLNTRNYQFQELDLQQLPVDQIEELSAEWSQTRTIKTREVIFLNRPFCLDPEPDVRRFCLFNDQGQLQAFAFFDPLYRDGNVIGYTTVFKRRRKDASIYAETGLVKYAVEKFKKEGLEVVTLGLAPLAGQTNDRYRANPMMTWGWGKAFHARWTNWFYNMKGHAQYKDHFHGEQVKNYFCSRAYFADLRVTAMLRMMRVI